jgi:Glyoxalase-like domain
MRVELDHLFVLTAPGAPEADKFVQFGLHEGPPNQHPGQGTANRRFPLANAMIELLWVNDPTEAQNPCTRRTLLWERWSDREADACPFGICLSPVDAQDTGTPFPGWEYRPSYLPGSLSMHIGESGIEEPMWVYLNFQRREYYKERFAENPVGIREITGLTLTTCVPLRSRVSQTIIESGIIASRTGPRPLLEIEFDGGARNKRTDFRPRLPILFQL